MFKKSVKIIKLFPLSKSYDKRCVLAKLTQLCLSLCDPKDCSLPGSSVRGILQARVLEWVALPSSGDIPDRGTEPRSPALQADSLPSEPPGKP